MNTQPQRGPAAQTALKVALCDLGLAPENLRAAEPEDADVPRLAETIAAAGLIYPLMVRRGRKGEAAYMVLDGRRRRFALLRLAADGRLAADHPVDCLVAEDRAAQAAAAVLPNAEHAPVHLADVILAIGKLRRTRLSTAAIAAALGYDETEVRRLEAMARVHPDVLHAFRLGKLNLRQVRLFARVKDANRQAELVQPALNGWFHESIVQGEVTGGRVTLDDARFDLVSQADYAAAGGRLKTDLFGELPTEVLDPDVLDACWRAEAERLTAALVDVDIALTFGRERGFLAPEGLEHLPFVYWGALSAESQAAFDAARRQIEAKLETLARAEPEGRDAAMAEVLRARLELARLTAGSGEVKAAVVTPVRGGLDVTFYHRPAPRAEDPGDGPEGAEADGDVPDTAEARGAPEPAVEVEGVSHALHAARTEVATRGLIADLAADPDAAIVALTAQLFGQVMGLGRSVGDTALRVRAVGFGRPDPEDTICGPVWGRLLAHGEAFEGLGADLVGYVGLLSAPERTRLLADLGAVTLDLRESRTDQVRRAARAEALAIADLCGADLARRWTPDAGFLALHTAGQLAGFLEAMGAEAPRAKGLRKAELVQAVAEAAAARGWIPDALRWPTSGPADQDPGDAADGAPADG